MCYWGIPGQQEFRLPAPHRLGAHPQASNGRCWVLLSRKSKAGELGAPWPGQELLLAPRWCLDAAHPGSLPLPVGTQTVSLFPVPRGFE